MTELLPDKDFADISEQSWPLFANMSEAALAGLKTKLGGQLTEHGELQDIGQPIFDAEKFLDGNAWPDIGPSMDADKKSHEKRINAVRHLVRLFGDEPEVLIALERGKSNPRPTTFNENATTQFMHVVGQYDPPTDVEYLQYFTAINDALDIYEDNGGNRLDPDELSPETRQIFVDAVISRQMLMIKNQRLLFVYARPYLSRKILDLNELVQEGNIGLERAIPMHDHSRGTFSSYAAWSVKNCIHGGLGNNKAMRLPKNVYEEWYPVTAQVKKLKDELSRDPTVDEIAEHTGVSTEKITKVLDIAPDPISLETKIVDNDKTLYDVVADQKYDGEDEVDRMIQRIDIGGIFSSESLNDKEKLVLGLTYGLFDMIPDDLEILDSKTGEAIDYQSRINEQFAVIAEEYKNREQWWLKRENNVGLEPKHISKIIGIPTPVLASVRARALSKCVKVLVSNITRNS